MGDLVGGAGEGKQNVGAVGRRGADSTGLNSPSSMSGLHSRVHTARPVAVQGWIAWSFDIGACTAPSTCGGLAKRIEVRREVFPEKEKREWEGFVS